MPASLTHGFEVAGGILPAVGFGLLLRDVQRNISLTGSLISRSFVIHQRTCC